MHRLQHISTSALLTLFALLAKATVSPTALLAQGDPVLVNQDVEARVLATEDAWVAAEIARDEAMLRRLADDRFVYNHSDGRTSDKAEFIQSVMSMSMVDQTISERSVLVEDDIALVFGTAALHLAGKDDEITIATLRYTATYVNRDGEWKMLALQMQRRAVGE